MCSRMPFSHLHEVQIMCISWAVVLMDVWYYRFPANEKKLLPPLLLLPLCLEFIFSYIHIQRCNGLYRLYSSLSFVSSLCLGLDHNRRSTRPL